MKKFEILWELPKCDKETWREEMLSGKWHQSTCSTQGCHKASNCQKKKIIIISVRTAIKWGLPVYIKGTQPHS